MDSVALDAHWRTALKDETRFSLEWYREHPITKELRKANIHQGHLIEFGCGIGARTFLARQLYPLGIDTLRHSVVGVDGSAFAIDYAKKHWAARGLHFAWGDLLDLNWDDNLFDNGYMLAVIEHIEDTDTLLSECRRVIKPGGKLFVSVTEKNFHSDPGHVRSYNARELGRTLEAVGKPVEVYVKGHIIYGTVEVR